MPDRQEAAVVTCPANTPVTAPVEVSLPWVGGKVRHIELLIPDGHAYLTGIAIGYGHQPIMPRTGQSYYSGNDETIKRDYNDKVPGVPWSAFLCNLDVRSHTWEVRMDMDDEWEVYSTVARPAPTAEDILAAGAAAMAGSQGA